MIWLPVIVLALAALAAVMLLSRQSRAALPAVLAALALGLAGYASQASPGIGAAPRPPAGGAADQGRQFVSLRAELVGEPQRSRSPFMLMADEWVRRGRYQGAVTILRGVVKANPADGDAWLALANALLLHADGQLTAPALYAFRQAERALPGSAAPAFFLGVGMIREGRLIEAHRLWSGRLAQLPAEAPGRAILARRLAMLEQLMRQIVRESRASGQ